MLIVACPHCGPRAQTEFVYERTADAIVRPDADPKVAMAALFTRTNPRGADAELWRHTYGCRAWLVMTRDRVTHKIESIREIGPEALP